MIRHEFRKILKNRFFIVFFLTFILCDIFLIYKREYTEIFAKSIEGWERNEENYNRVKGIMTNDKFEYAKSINPELLIYGGSELYRNMMEAYEYKEKAEMIYNRAVRNVEIYDKMGKSDIVYINEKIAEVFKGRELTEYYRQDGVDEYLTYDYSTAMTMVLVVISVIILFFLDRRIGMDRVVRTSKNGEGCIRVIRTMAVVVIGIVAMCLFRLIEYIEYCIIYRFDGLHMPLYSVTSYMNTLYGGSIESFFCIDILLKCMGVLLFSLLAILLVNAIKMQKLDMTGFAVIYFISIAVSMVTDNLYTPIRLFDGYSLVKSTEFINIGHMYLSSMGYTIFLSCIVVLLLLLGIGMVKER